VRTTIALALILVIAACAPAATEPFDTTEGARSFSLVVDGTPAARTGTVHSVVTDDVRIDATIEHDRILMDVTNESPGLLRIHPDRSTFVFDDDARSPVVTGATSWDTRDDPQPAIEIPAGETASLTLIPRSHLAWDDGLVIEPLFPWPLADLISLRLMLGVELQGENREVALMFVGRPQ
jgi:hypothetical protein